MKAKSVQLKEAVTIPGTKILGEMSIQPEKHPSADLTISAEGILVQDQGVVALIPLSNVKSIVLQAESSNGRSEQTSKKSK
jgi:hypothetical protein